MPAPKLPAWNTILSENRLPRFQIMIAKTGRAHPFAPAGLQSGNARDETRLSQRRFGVRSADMTLR
jgi:hypothetical protein